jgi:hypothetical protein
MCHFDITWPGGVRDQLIGSSLQEQEGGTSRATRMLPKAAATVAAALSVNVLMHIFV